MQKKKPIVGIYKITSPTGRHYIGQSTNMRCRKNKYSNLRCKSQPKIFRSLMKYGWDNHTFDIIEECTVEQLDELELKWKIFYNSVEEGLNCHYLDLNGGYKSEETKKKMSNSQKGKHLCSAEHIAIIVKTNTGNKYNVGRKDSEEVNLKRSISLKETRKHKKWACGQKKGYKASEEHRQALRVPCSEAAKQNMRKPKSEQARINMRGPKPHLYVSVNQLDLDGNFIKNFPSVTDAYIFLNKPTNGSCIACCMKGRQKTAYGYRWEYA